MPLIKRSSICVFAFLALCVGGATLGQEAVEPAVREALLELKRAKPYKRSGQVERIVEFGKAAVPGLVGELRAFQQQADTSYVANCILALGELKGLGTADRKTAMGVLIPALHAQFPQIRYAAALALKQIWTAGEGRDLEALRAVNAALAGSLFDMSVSSESYGPGLALFEINNVDRVTPKAGGPAIRPASLTPEELRDQVESWVAENPDLLPPLDQQPWQLLLATVGRNPDPAARQEARGILVRKRPLLAVDTIARYLRSGTLDAALWRDLADVLAGITGQEFPRTLPPEPGVVVSRWMQEWEEHLKGRRDEAHRRYSWQRFERAVALARNEPTGARFEEVRHLREILLHQFDALADMPEDASPRARELIEGMLGAKANCVEAVKGLQGDPSDHQKRVYIGRMEQVADSEGGKAIARQFLGELVALARKEESQQILNQVARLLTSITDVPLQLPAELTPAARGKVIEDWLGMVRQYEAGGGEKQ